MKKPFLTDADYLKVVLVATLSVICVFIILAVRLDQQAAKEIQTLQKMKQDLNNTTVVLKQGRYMISRHATLSP